MCVLFDFTIDTVITAFALYDVKISLLLPIIHFNLPTKSIIANIISIESAPNKPAAVYSERQYVRVHAFLARLCLGSRT